MMIFLDRPCSTISASTVTPATVGRPTSTLPASSANRSGPKLTLVPAVPVSFSTRRVSPSLTRYCFPPDTMTAYMCELPPGERRSLDISRQLSSVQGLRSGSWPPALGLRLCAPGLEPGPVGTGPGFRSDLERVRRLIYPSLRDDGPHQAAGRHIEHRIAHPGGDRHDAALAELG